MICRDACVAPRAWAFQLNLANMVMARRAGDASVPTAPNIIPRPYRLSALNIPVRRFLYSSLATRP